MEDAGGAIGGLICVSVVCVGFGLAMIFARDFMWELTHFSNQLGGEKSERTEVWESGQIISGVILIFAGLGLACWGFSEYQTRASETADATATAQTQLTRLQDTFGSYIVEWDDVDGERVYFAEPSSVGIRAQGIYYGRCSGNDFYLFVVNWNDQDFAYVPENEPQYCQPAGMWATTWTSYGGGWYRVFARRDHEAVISSTPRPTQPTRTPRPTNTPTLTPTFTPRPPTRTPVPTFAALPPEA